MYDPDTLINRYFVKESSRMHRDIRMSFEQQLHHIDFPLFGGSA